MISKELNEEYVSPREAADRLKLRYGQVMRRIRSGQLPAQKVGWGWVISKKDLQEYQGGNYETGVVSS